MNNCTIKGNRRGYHFFIPKPLILLDKYTRWKKTAEALKLSKQAKNRLEWFIYYETKGQYNASLTSRYFGISTKTFHKWKKIFNPANLRTLEDKSKAPKSKRQRQITSLEESRVILLRKKHIRWGKMKLKRLYRNTYSEDISSWKIQYTIKRYKLYFNPIKNEQLQKKRKRNQAKKRITELKKKPFPGYLIALYALPQKLDSMLR